MSSIKKIDVAGLKINAITKAELLAQIIERVARHEKTFVVTPYSEFLYASLRSKEVRELLNSADFSVADGVGILWAHLFMSQPLVFKNYYFKILELWWQVAWTGASVLLHPISLYKDIPEKIVGADLVWDLARLAEQNNFSVYLLGARGDVAKTVAQKFQSKFPNLKIVGTSNKEVGDLSIIEDVNSAKPDILLVAFNRLTSEQWIAENLPKLETSFAIGLGGTFDYIAGVKVAPPRFVRDSGLEWLYRLITQPTRLVRIFHATWGMILALVRYKVHSSKLKRRNAVAVVINTNGKILLCKRISRPYGDGSNPGVAVENYWQFPQGGVEKGESIDMAAQRELMEEVGISNVTYISQAEYINTYDWNNATRKLFYAKYHLYRGQDQYTVFYKYTHPSEELILPVDIFDEYQWVDPEYVISIIASERREHAENVLAELAKIQLK